MLQVNRIKYFVLLLSLVLLTTGCSMKNNLEKKDYTSEKVYEDVNKDAIFLAMKKVFDFSGGNKFILESYRNNLHVIRPKMVHKPFLAYITEDKWDITIEEKNNESYVKIVGKKIIEMDEENPQYFHKNSHELIWLRLEYLLGLSNEWYTCIYYRATFSDGSALCDVINLANATTPTANDILKDISFSDRKTIKTLSDTSSDILKDDIDLVLDEESETNKDLLNLANDETQEASEEKFDILDEEIRQLDKKVNDNIDITLDSINETKQSDDNKE